MSYSSADRSPKARTMANWATFSVLLAVVVIMLGAWTRLVDAGLGCPDWPGCYGFITVPQSDSHIAIANARFPDTPVDVAKGWPEMIHRYAAGALGLVVFGLAASAIRQRRSGVPFKLPLFIAAFILLQGAFGMWTVTLKLWPQVVALHLLGGFTTLSLLTLLVLRLRKFSANQAASAAHSSPNKTEKSTPILAGFRPWLFGGLLLIIMQIALGAWTAANYAAVACTDLPTCQGQWWPDGMDFQHGFDITQHVGPNYLGGQLTADGRVAIHVTHRVGALVVLGYFAVLLILIRRRDHNRDLQGPTGLVAAVLVAQITLGLANVIFYIPLPIAVAHNAMGAGLLLSGIYLIWRHYHLPLQAQVKAETHTTIMHQEITA